jgi:TrmH family RNA methyltransferase
LKTSDEYLSVTSISNQHCQRIRALGSAKARHLEKAFIVEGMRLLNEAALNNQQPDLMVVSESVVIEDCDTAIKKLLSLAKERIVVPDELLRRLSPAETTQGILGVFEMPKTEPAEYFAEVNTHFLVLDQISDPGNVGTLLRSAASFSCGVVLTPGCADIWSPKVVRSSMGALFRPVFCYAEVEEWSSICLAKGIELMVTSSQGRDIRQLELHGRKVAFVIGNEARGVADFWRQHAIETVAIAMNGQMESLNAAVAGSIFAYEASR